MHDVAQGPLDQEHTRPQATWNSTLAIHALPNELIIDIFVLCCRAHTFAGCARDEVSLKKCALVPPHVGVPPLARGSLHDTALLAMHRRPTSA